MFWPSIILQLESPSSPQVKLRSPNTMNIHQKTNSTSLQDTRFQPLDLCDEVSIYRWLKGGESSSGVLISFLLSGISCFHLENADLLFIPGRKQRGKCQRGSFWKIPWSSTSHFVTAICPFPTITPYRGAIQYACTLYTGKVICIAPSALGFQHGPILTIYEQCLVENFWEMM